MKLKTWLMTLVISNLSAHAAGECVLKEFPDLPGEKVIDTRSVNLNQNGIVSYTVSTTNAQNQRSYNLRVWMNLRLADDRPQIIVGLTRQAVPSNGDVDHFVRSRAKARSLPISVEVSGGSASRGNDDRSDVYGIYSLSCSE